MKSRHDEIRKKYGKVDGMSMSVPFGRELMPQREM